MTAGGGGPVFQAAGPETKTIFSPLCTKWSLGQADSTTEVDPALNLFSTFLHPDPGRDLAEKLAFGRQTHQWLSKSRSQFRSQGGSTDLLGSGDDGEVWG